MRALLCVFIIGLAMPLMAEMREPLREPPPREPPVREEAVPVGGGYGDYGGPYFIDEDPFHDRYKDDPRLQRKLMEDYESGSNVEELENMESMENEPLIN